MRRISCIIFVICVYSCIAFTIASDDVVGKRYKRMALGVDLLVEKCAHIGSTCSVRRDKADKPTHVIVLPCCEHLTCVGIGPTELRNPLGQAVRSSDFESSGICSLSLDNNQASEDHDQYVEYVKGL